ncbi:MAG: indole-3-glycerol phosphate synthase TrpC, partial [Actinomycetota bacterium]|nr:indole-3-glycerol phosphate synthase TrpC [Actinomycetota bacterium]
PFAGALTASDRGEVALIAEVKRRSPSRGDLAPGLVAGELARAYEAGGAACLSVLTDEPSFGGSAADLAEARGACALPVLRKDFTVDERDVADARIMGADAVLLIVAALDAAELAAFTALAGELGMTALVEVHGEGELDRALVAGATVVGVNARDLTTFTVDRTLAERLAPAIPEGVVRVAESGIRDRDDVARLAAAGFDAVLVGETLVTSARPSVAAAALLGRES